MPDVNAPFVCGCGASHFHRLVQFNALNCELETDPEKAPMVIACPDCGRRFQQTPEWGWEAVPRSTPSSGSRSAQPCGCDEGANWKCVQHREAAR